MSEVRAEADVRVRMTPDEALPIDRPLWQRMPWHPRAQAIAKLAAEERDVEQRVANAWATFEAIEAEMAGLEQRLAHVFAAAEHIFPAIEDLGADQVRRAAHAAYARGVREPWVIDGERDYQRRRVRAPRRVS